MDLKFVIFVVCMAICRIFGQNIKCDYDGNHWFSYDVLKVNKTYYTCKLDTRNINYNSIPTIIEGFHLAGKSDSDVKYFRNYETLVLKTLSSIYCQKFANIEVIYISDGQILTVDENALQNCRNLKYLVLKGNIFSELPEYLLIANIRLRSIEIQRCKLKSLPGNFFINQNLLEYIHLSETKLKVINPEWFKNTVYLSYFAFYESEITRIPSKAFKPVKNLKSLYLYNNRIQTLYPDSFEGLDHLELLNLHENQISDLPANVFYQLKNLKELSLNTNALTVLNSDSFSLHPYLKKMFLQNNTINAIDQRIIENTAVDKFFMENNVCSSANIFSRNEIKPQLTRCFANYRPRIQSSGQITNQRPTAISNFQNSADSCGRPVKAQGNIIKGTAIDRGTFPWLAALLLKSGKFFCGGALISKRKVLTAAHCIREKNDAHFFSSNDFVVLLGSHDLNKNTEVGRQTFGVEKINIHPDWNVNIEAFDADVTVLILATDALFTSQVQPICMMSPNSPIASINKGIVVGYGKSEDETKDHENIPKMLKMPIHKNEECFLKNYLLVKISSRRTFCAGEGRGQGVCSGDSGGGLFVNYQNTYYLRGIVSSSIFTPTTCDVNTYSVFTNVLYYYDWINKASGNPFLNFG